MSEWMPIATAPRDGTVLLLWDGSAANLGYWPPGKPRGWVCDMPDVGGDAIWLQPTHWQPIPAPPAQEGDNA